jgi:hypothetical protein
MSVEMSNELGKIIMTEDLVASIAGYAACENYGIVGMSSKKASDATLSSLKRTISNAVSSDLGWSGEVVSIFTLAGIRRVTVPSHRTRGTTTLSRTGNDGAKRS